MNFLIFSLIFLPISFAISIPKIPKIHQQQNSNPKTQAIENFKTLVSKFLSDAQISKSIDIFAVGVHKGHKLEQVFENIATFLHKNLTSSQLSSLVKSRKQLSQKFSSPEKLAKIESQIQRMIIYSIDPAAEQIHLNARQPSAAFSLISATLNPKFVASLRDLIEDVLGEQIYEQFKKVYSPEIVYL
ncbi:unnamed protein product [Caenorhabditis angaria]|uniref:Uncharacterized protein n=1 Tax=Caenorhabditis angaria TaxID=860376 RepID=A0A9P1ICZ1_9PELO|nr:unnamed protein product [Caenorhabditis angaria]